MTRPNEDATEIIRLTEERDRLLMENERLRKALEEIEEQGNPGGHWSYAKFTDVARAALKSEKQ